MGPVYTVVAYRRDYDDYRRHGESYASAFTITNNLTRDQATLLIAEYASQNKACRNCNQPDWEVYVLKEGVKIIDNFYPQWDGLDRCAGYPDDWDTLEAAAVKEAEEMLDGVLTDTDPPRRSQSGRAGRAVEID